MLSQSTQEREKQSLRMRVTRRVLATLGWKLITNTPPNRKYVTIFAPHTSIWDYPLFISVMASIGTHYRWFTRSKLFIRLLTPITRYFGGFELTRDSNSSLVNKLSDKINKSESLSFCLTPEGSMSYVPRWCSGFYYIALSAEVPIALGFIDYKNKTLGFGAYFMPTGDIDEDLTIIRRFYRNITPKSPDHAGLIKL